MGYKFFIPQHPVASFHYSAIIICLNGMHKYNKITWQWTVLSCLAASETLHCTITFRLHKYRIYANLMRTSIFKTLKPKKVFAGEYNADRQKVHSLQQWFFITNSILQKKKNNNNKLFFDKPKKKVDLAGLDHPIYRMPGRRSTTTLLRLWQGLSIWSN
jgi:hypothetical protein